MCGLWRNFENNWFEQAMVSGACYPKKVSISSLLWVALGIAVVLSPTPNAHAQGLGVALPPEGAVADSGEPIPPLPELSYKQRTYEEPPDISLGRSLVAKPWQYRVRNDNGGHPPR